MDVCQKRTRSGWERCQKEQGLEKTRGFLQVLGHLNFFPARKQELQKEGHTARLPLVLSPSCLHGAMVKRATLWLAEPSTDRGMQDKELFFFPPMCRFFLTLSMQLRGFLKYGKYGRYRSMGSMAGIVWLLHTTQQRNCFTLSVWYLLFSIRNGQILPHF